jgi:hypothetical protein
VREYVSVFSDLDQRRGVFSVEGGDHETVQAFSLFPQTHGGDPGQVKEVCQDMSEAFLKGTTTYLPSAEIAFDRYHVRSHRSHAVDEFRREEARRHKDLLRNTRYMWLKGPAKLTGKQRELVDELHARPLETVRAHTPAQQSRSFYGITDPDMAQEFLRRSIIDACGSELEPLARFGDLLEDRRDGVTRWHHSQISNALLEALNSLIQAAKRLARGYRTNGNFIALIYRIAGKLNAGAPSSDPRPTPRSPQDRRPERVHRPTADVSGNAERTARCGPICRVAWRAGASLASPRLRRARGGATPPATHAPVYLRHSAVDCHILDHRVAQLQQPRPCSDAAHGSFGLQTTTPLEEPEA